MSENGPGRGWRVGMTVVGVLAVAMMIGGGWFLVRSLGGPDALSRVESADPADVIDLPTSEWEPGSDGHNAQSGGVLRLDGDGCVYLDADFDGEEFTTYAIWPKGYAALRVGDSFEMLDPDGDVVARGGDEVSLGGGYSDRKNTTSCLPGGGASNFYVHSGVTVMPERRAGLSDAPGTATP